MSLKWVDVLEIAIQLAESKPEVDPRYLNFVNLSRWVQDRRTRLSDTSRLGNALEPAYNSRV